MVDSQTTANAAVTEKKHSGLIPFAPGQSGNPAGRPKGARSKLGEAFIKAMLADFEKNGMVAVETVRETKPDQYLRVIASILPKEITGEDGEPIAFVGQVILKGVRPDADG